MIKDESTVRRLSPTVPESYTPLHDQLCFAIYSATHAFTKRYKDYLRKFNVTYPQYLVLTVLWEADAQTVKAIGDRLHLDSGTLTPLLKRLELGGLVRRAKDLRDERQVRVSLTPAGRNLCVKTLEIQAEIVCATGLSPDRMNKLRDDIIRLRDQLRSGAD